MEREQTNGFEVAKDKHFIFLRAAATQKKSYPKSLSVRAF